MSGTYILLPPEGSPFWQNAVANPAALPAAGAVVGEARIALSSGAIYFWTGSVWQVDTAVGYINSISDTNSIDLTVTVDALSADLKLSAAAADANFFLSATAIKADGLQVETRIADTTHTGVISSTDWNTFNNKEPAISSGTTSQYWRGDKTFQTLNVAALGVVTDGSAAAASHVGELITSQVTSATTTGVGLTGVYGNVTSISLTAGVWEIYGVAGFSENSAVLTQSLSCGFSSTADGTGLATLDPAVYPFTLSGSSDAVLVSPKIEVSLSGTTTYYLNTRFFYTSGTPMHYGRITGRRLR